MQTREEAIAKLERALQILQETESLQAEIERTRASSPLQLAAAQQGKKHTGIPEKIGVWLGCYIVLGTILSRIIEAMGLRYSLRVEAGDIPTLILAIFPAIIICKLINQYRDKKNVEIEAKAAAARGQIQEIQRGREMLLGRLQADLDAYNREVKPWLPDEYSSTPTVSVLLQFLRSGRADSLKEAMNLYEEEAYRRRMEEGQRKLARGQGLQTLAMAASAALLQSDIAKTRKAVDNLRSARNPYENRKW